MNASAIEIRNAVSDPQDSDSRAVLLGGVDDIEVRRETAKAVLLVLVDAAGNEHEAWFPKSVLCTHPDHNPAFGENLFATRAFIGRNRLWNWTRA